MGVELIYLGEILSSRGADYDDDCLEERSAMNLVEV